MLPKLRTNAAKVDLGQNAPNKTEAAGLVGSESLASESYREGGEFSNNVGTYSENVSSTSNLESTPATTSSTTRSQQSAPKSDAGTAPRYVDAQYIKESGPHGKNLQEGFDDSGLKDGTNVAMNAELGSKDDPARAAELQFQYNQDAKGRAAGPKQGSLTNETKYDALNSETSS